MRRSVQRMRLMAVGAVLLAGAGRVSVAGVGTVERLNCPVLTAAGNATQVGVFVMGQIAVGPATSGADQVGIGVLPCWLSGAEAGGTPGDLNCDGLISLSDIAPFVLALTDLSAYGQQFPGCDPLHGDLSGDGAVTVSDIGFFVALLTGG